VVAGSPQTPTPAQQFKADEEKAEAAITETIAATPAYTVPSTEVLRTQNEARVAATVGNSPAVAKLVAQANDPMAPPEVKAQMQVAAKEAATTAAATQASADLGVAVNKEVAVGENTDKIYMEELIDSVKDNKLEEVKTKEALLDTTKAEEAVAAATATMNSI